MTFMLFQIAMSLVTSTNAVLLTSRNNESLNEIPSGMDPSSTDIDLSYNNITSCPGYAFNSFTDLTNLNMDSNNIDTVDEDTFFGTPIVSLLLSDNRLTRIPDLNAISSTLETLILDFNEITAVSIGHFVNISKLKYLSLNGNPLLTFEAPDMLQVDGNSTTPFSHCLHELYLQNVPTAAVTNASYSGLTCLHRLLSFQ